MYNQVTEGTARALAKGYQALCLMSATCSATLFVLSLAGKTLFFFAEIFRLFLNFGNIGNISSKAGVRQRVVAMPVGKKCGVRACLLLGGEWCWQWGSKY